MLNLDAELNSPASKPAEKPKVLVVDDNESILQNLTVILSHNGFEVSSACNVKQALALIGSETFDVLVSDLHMPEPGDGLTVVSAMRHSNPKAVTLIFSAFPEMKQAAAAILRQADEVLVKPLAAQDLIKSIREHLRQGAPAPAQPLQSVAELIERNARCITEEWIESVRRWPGSAAVPLEDHERCAHLPQLFRDMVIRLRFPLPFGTHALVSASAAEHGQRRRSQGYTPAMLVEESRLLQISIFNALQDNLPRMDFSVLLVGVMSVADEIESQLAQQMASFLGEANPDRSVYEKNGSSPDSSCGIPS